MSTRSPQEVLNDLESWSIDNGHGADAETAHYKADELLLEAIQILGDRSRCSVVAREIVEAFGKVLRWYA